MLTQIHISNLITIHELHLDFQTGTTVITGETGAGKSILIDAIELALGQRITTDIIRNGQDKADIHLCFDVGQLPIAKQWLEQYDLGQESNECMIRRTIHRDGRSRSFINGMPTTLQPLRELSELLIQIHGQHEHQSLLKSDTQRNILDRFAKHQQLVDSVHHIANQWQTLNHQVTQLREGCKDRQNRAEFLKFQLQELEALHLLPNEFQALDLEHKQLAHAEELLQQIQQTLTLLIDQEDHNVVGTLNESIHALELIQKVDPTVTTWIQSIQQSLIHLSDAENEMRRYLENVELDPERLKWVDQRISILFDMARKHKVNPQDLFERQTKMSQEYSELETDDTRILELTNQLHALEKQYDIAAKALSISRMHTAKKLAQTITQMIQTLSLPHAEFSILCNQENLPRISPYGMEKIIFQIKTNAGQSMQSLAKTASGGEISRISLAVYIATAGKYATPTLIFDEIDVGVGGGTAQMVGKLLRQLGETHQVLCITHQPQVAALGHHHLKVQKMSSKENTHTDIQVLSPSEKITEIARMLGGIEMTKKTLAHARELVEKV